MGKEMPEGRGLDCSGQETDGDAGAERSGEDWSGVDRSGNAGNKEIDT